MVPFSKKDIVDGLQKRKVLESISKVIDTIKENRKQEQLGHAILNKSEDGIQPQANVVGIDSIPMNAMSTVPTQKSGMCMVCNMGVLEPLGVLDGKANNFCPNCGLTSTTPHQENLAGDVQNGINLNKSLDQDANPENKDIPPEEEDKKGNKPMADKPSYLSRFKKPVSKKEIPQVETAPTKPIEGAVLPEGPGKEAEGDEGSGGQLKKDGIPLTGPSSQYQVQNKGAVVQSKLQRIKAASAKQTGLSGAMGLSVKAMESGDPRDHMAAAQAHEKHFGTQHDEAHKFLQAYHMKGFRPQAAPVAKGGMSMDRPKAAGANHGGVNPPKLGSPTKLAAPKPPKL